MALNAENLDIAYFATKLWMLGVRLLVVPMQMFCSAASFAHGYLLETKLDGASCSMTPLGCAAIPSRMILPPRGGVLSAARSRTVYCWPTVSLTSHKFLLAAGALVRQYLCLSTWLS